MRFKKFATVAAMSATLVGLGAGQAVAANATPAPGTSTTGTPTTGMGVSTCLPDGRSDAWPAWVDGRPGRDPGVRVWHDANGWHVRVTHDTMHDRVFSGEIKTRGELVDVQAVRLEKNDSLQVGPDHHGLRFRFNNYGGTDGFDFSTHCAPFLEFGFTTDGHIVRPVHISIGAAGRHPATDPFVIRRTA